MVVISLRVKETLILTFILALLVYTFLELFFKTSQVIKHDDTSAKAVKKVIRTSSVVISELDWIDVSSDSDRRFIRNGPAFFFLELFTIRFFMLTNSEQTRYDDLIFRVKINVLGREILAVDIVDVIIDTAMSSDGLIAKSVDANLPMLNLDLSKVDPNLLELSLLILVKDKPKENRLKLKVIYPNNGIRKNTSICARCTHLDGNNDLKKLKKWSQMNKLLGYEKISTCLSGPISENKLRQSLVYLDTVKRVKCAPNFESNGNAECDPVSFGQKKFDSIDWIQLNECYLENMGEFAHVAILGTKELIIPRDDMLIKTSSIDQYIQKLSQSSDKLLYFGVAHYVSSEFAASFLKLLDGSMVSFKVANTSIRIESKQEKLHAHKLLQTYRKNFIGKLDEGRRSMWNRFLIVKSEQDSLGRSIHSTQESFEMGFYSPVMYIDQKSKTIEEYLTPKWKKVSFEQGYVSIFGDYLTEKSQLSITMFEIDLAYFDFYRNTIQ